MKFGKEFVSQMVPEWQNAYMNYNSLKIIVKDISKFNEQNESKSSMASTPKGSLRRRLTLYRAFSGLNGSNQRESSSKSEDEVILIRSIEDEDSKGFYQTIFLEGSADGAERDLEFFRKLDFEFNKVNVFYKKVVKEVVDEAEELSKQMNVLIAFRIKVDKIGFENVDTGYENSSSIPFMLHFNDDAKHDIQHKMKKKMPQSICISPTRTKPEAALLVTEGLPLSSAPTTESMIKSTTLLDTIDTAKESSEFPPVEIGTRGTVASLIMQEIDYFSRIESNSQDRSQRNNKSQFTNVGSSHSTNSRSTIVSTVESTKKKRVSSKLLPSMCSMVDVSDGGRPNGTSAFGYRNLRSDTKKFQL